MSTKPPTQQREHPAATNNATRGDQRRPPAADNAARGDQRRPLAATNNSAWGD
ncbi:MAG TPA: hypothetical protein H9755_04125 [Candidatus Dietzia intestinigallinarum]|nr:hypothetical protein [Candidatus Dietzia intestinigallinarum]